MSHTSKQEVIDLIKEKHLEFLDHIFGLSEREYNHQKGEKWTAGQQLQHIIKCMKPLVKVFGMAPAMIQAFFGRDKSHKRSESELVDLYREKLSAGNTKAPDRFGADENLQLGRDEMAETFKSLLNALTDRIQKFDEEDIDSLLVKHPLLGKMTLKEMLFNAVHHVEHHQSQTVQNNK